MFSKYIFVYRKIKLTWNSGWAHIRNLNVQGRESQHKEVVTVPQTSNKTQQNKREGVVKSNAKDSNLGQLFSSSLLESWTSASLCQSHLSWWFKWHKLCTIIRNLWTETEISADPGIRASIRVTKWRDVSSSPSGDKTLWGQACNSTEHKTTSRAHQVSCSASSPVW